MKPVFVLGNGISRIQFDLNKLKEHGKIVGCNALYRDFIPDILVAVDKPMIDEIIESGVHRRCCFMIEDDDKYRDYLIRPSINGFTTNVPSRMDSGNLACMIAATYSNTVYMIGFDYIAHNGKFNNMYAGSKNYKSKSEPHVLKVTEESWYYRAIITFLRYPQVQFYRVNNNNYKPPLREFNFQNISPERFNEMFDCYNPNIEISVSTQEEIKFQPVIGRPNVIMHSKVK